MGRYQKRMGKGVLAWLLALAMILTGISLTGNAEKAQAGEVDLSADKVSEENVPLDKNQDGDDYIRDVKFGIPDIASTKSALESNGVKSIEVILTVTSYSGTKPSVMLYVQPGQDGDWNWNQTDGKEVASNQQITLSYDFSEMNWNGGSTMGNLVLRFASGSVGTKISYRIDSAKLITNSSSGESAGSSAGGSSNGENATAEQLQGISVKVNSLGGNPDWCEYNLSITNSNPQVVEGFVIRIPVSGTVSNFQSWGKCSADYQDGYITIYHADIIAAGSVYSYGSDDKFGFGGGAVLGTPEVLVDDGEYTSSSKTNYALTGEKKNVAFEDTPLGMHGKLQLKEVEGYSAPIIVDQYGKPYQLRGASTHGMQWFPEYVNKDSFQSLRDEWGVNMVRLVSYVTQYNGYTLGGQELLDKKIMEGVEYASELGMYVIVDWHIHEENPHTTKAQAEEFFQKYAAMYQDYDNVIFEICNEPVGVEWYNGSGGDLYSYCKDIAGIIRNAGSDALIVCGTNTWSQDVEDVAKKPLKDDGFHNILYTFHFYSGSHYNDKMDKVKKATAAGTPIFVTEFGICDASGNGGYDTANADKWIELLDSYNISYACWSLCNKDESASYLLPGCSRYSGWLESDLSKTGIWLVNTYRAHQDKENGEDTGKGENSGSGANTGGSTNPGENENPGENTNPEGNGNPEGNPNPGENENPGGNPNPGENENPGESTNPGENENPGGSTNPGENENPGGSINPGENDNPGGSINPGGNDNIGENVNSEGNDNLGGSASSGSSVNSGSSTTPGESSNPGDPGKQNSSGENGQSAKVDQMVLSQKTDNDIKGSVYAKLALKAANTTKNSVTLKWNKVSGANCYVIYGNRCGNANRLQKLKTVTGTSWIHKKLSKGTYYKYVVVACRGDAAVSIAKTVHATTAGGKKGNAKNIKLNKTKVQLKKGKKIKIKATMVASPKKTKIAIHRRVAYESSNSKIASVSSGGVIKARKKGSCVIYVYAQNGVGRKVKVVVK